MQSLRAEQEVAEASKTAAQNPCYWEAPPEATKLSLGVNLQDFKGSIYSRVTINRIIIIPERTTDNV